MSDEQERIDNPEWHDVLMGAHPSLVRQRRIFRHLPSDPRCKVCLSPHGGIGGPIGKLFGFGPYAPNPQLCNRCYVQSTKHPGGTEIEITVLFADIRGSTGVAEEIGARAYSAAVNEYVRIASHAIREPGGLVDKLLGDGIMALFIPAFTGNHAVHAVGGRPINPARGVPPRGNRRPHRGGLGRLRRWRLDLRGRSSPVEAWSERIASPVPT